MNKIKHSVLLLFLFTQEADVHGQSDLERRGLVPTNNIAAARSRVPLSDLRRIAPNTPAFEEYGLNAMLTAANALREKWKLDIPEPLTVNDVLFQLKATAQGFDGNLGTRDNRFTWSFSRGAFTLFLDRRYWPRSFYARPEEVMRLATIKSKITDDDAVAIARGALHKLGVSEKQLHLKEPPQVSQFRFEGNDNKVHLLPLFSVSWRSEDHPEPQGDEFVYTPIRMNISGVSSNLADFHNACQHWPQTPLPTNYFQLLNLPTNFLETVPERTRVLWGLPPLTNSTSQTTNLNK